MHRLAGWAGCHPVLVPTGRDSRRDPRGPAVGLAGSRWMVLVVLGCGLLSKVTDASPHRTWGYVPFVVLLSVLPIWYATGFRRDVWAHHPMPLLLAQAAATYVPFAMFGHDWVGGASGLLAGLVLLVVGGRRGAALFTGLVGVELGWWLIVGPPYEPAFNSACWVLIATVNVGLGLVGLTRLADQIDHLTATRTALADSSILQLRLDAATQLHTQIGQRLRQLTTLSERAARSPSIADAERDLAQVALLARHASGHARRLMVNEPARTTAGTDHPGDTGTVVAARIARTTMGVVVVLFAVQYVINLALPTVGHPPEWPLVAVGIAVAIVAVALQLRHVSLTDTTRNPSGWRWTLSLLGVCAVALYPVAGAGTLALVAFPVASGLLLIRSPARWALLAAAVAGIPALTLIQHAPELTLQQTLVWTIYATATETSACLLIYGLARFTQVSVHLEQIRRQLADTASTQEHQRLIRDTHDVLGLGLSTIALKADLAGALLEREPGRASREIGQIVHVATTVAHDAASVSDGEVHLDLDEELAGAVQALSVATIATTVRAPSGGIDPQAKAAFAVVIREAVANIQSSRHRVRYRAQYRRTRSRSHREE